MTRADAIDEDASWPDSLARCGPDGPGSPTSHEEWDPLFTIARWNDVRRARAAVVREKLTQEVIELRARGYTEHEVARLTGLDRSTARRRFRATIEEILQFLGGEVDQAPALSVLSACLHCGQRPRARSRAPRRLVVAGHRRTVEVERQHSLCAECLPPERRHHLIGGTP